MPNPLLSQLNTTPAEVKRLSTRLRHRILHFLLRWQAWQEALDCLDPRELQRLVSLQDVQAEALLGLGDVVRSIAVLEARLRQRDGVAARNQLVRHYLAQDDTVQALTLAQALTETNADYGPNWSLLGDVHLHLGDLAAAGNAFLHHQQMAPSSRQPLIGLMKMHHRRGDGVTAAAYAIRAYTVNDGEFPLLIPQLRELHAYFVATGDGNRVVTAEVQLAKRVVEELAELRQALTAEADGTEAPRSTPKPTHRTAAAPALRPQQPLPDLSAIAVSEAERTTILTALHEYFGFTAFLPAQTEIIACTRRGEHVLAILPTGGGKSLCYQLPAFMEPGLTLVVSPLIALMKDQIDNLPPRLRNRAIAIHGEMDGLALQNAVRDLANGRYQLAYVTPERLRQLPFIHALRAQGLARLVIDEAHCVSVWGHDFRPDYLRLAEAHHELGSPPLLALTATAPPLVRQDIERQLFGKTTPAATMRLIATDIFRPNLQLHVIKVRDEDAKRQQLLRFCAGLPGSGIVYARTRQRCEEFAEILRQFGVNAAAFHAGLPNRAAIQEQFMAGEIRVMVATVAFGMGIDKADIRFVIHYGLPKTLEAYYQEIGRAGRDGAPAQCIMLYSTSDKAQLTHFAKEGVLPITFMRDLYGVLQGLLPGQAPCTLPMEQVQRALRCNDDTQVRVGLSVLEQVGLLRRYHDAPRTVTLARGPQAGDAAFVRFAERIRLPLHQRVDRAFRELADAGAIPLTDLEEQLHRWQAAGYLRYQTSMRDLLLALLPAPADTANHMASLLDQYATIQQQHVTDIVEYARSGYCRHGYLANYLGGQPRAQCTSCDNCGTAELPVTGPALPAETEQMQLILRALLEQGWGRRNLIHLLRGDRTLGEQAQASSAFGKLNFRSEGTLSKLIDQLIAEEMLAETVLPNGGIALRVTKRGRQLLTPAPPTDTPRPAPSATTAATPDLLPASGAVGQSRRADSEFPPHRPVPRLL
jgi:ATP-dependent DNA helicase RecQ